MPAQERGPIRPSRTIYSPELDFRQSTPARANARQTKLHRPRFVERRFGQQPETDLSQNAIRRTVAQFTRAAEQNPELTARADFWANQLGGLRKDHIPRRADIFVAKAFAHLEHQAEQARKDSERDSLTKLYNRKGIEHRFEGVFSRADRTGEHFTIAMADIDKFKGINDQYGHTCGDEILRQTARHVRESGRGHDIWGRFGGEEFIGLLPGAKIHHATGAMDRQRKNLPEAINKGLIAGKKFRLDRDVTISIGVATYDKNAYEERFGMRPEQLRRILIQKGHDLSAMNRMDHKDRVKILKDAEHTRRQTIFDYLINQADKALYKAKETGRNKVVVAAIHPVYDKMGA